MAKFGFDIFSIVAGLGIAGLAVGWASQSTLANFIAGVVILVEQSFQVGDWIRLGEKKKGVWLKSPCELPKSLTVIISLLSFQIQRLPHLRSLI